MISRGRLPALLALASALLLGPVGDASSSVGRSNPGQRAASTTAAAAPAEGDRAPGFTLRTLSGDRFRLSQLAGRPVLVNFWASWCRPCREEFPLFEKARERHQAEGLEIVGVAYRDIASDARHFARSRDAGWPLVFDGSGAVASDYGVGAVPQTFLVRRDGTVAGRQFGGYRSRKDLETDLATILSP